MSKNKKGFIPSRRKPERVDSTLGRILSSYRIEKKIEEYKAFPYWDDAVGETIAKIAYPERISNKCTLIVRVIDIAWAQELSFQKPQILSELHAYGLSKSVQDIRFLSGNPNDFPAAKS